MAAAWPRPPRWFRLRDLQSDPIITVIRFDPGTVVESDTLGESAAVDGIGFDLELIVIRSAVDHGGFGTESSHGAGGVPHRLSADVEDVVSGFQRNGAVFHAVSRIKRTGCCAGCERHHITAATGVQVLDRIAHALVDCPFALALMLKRHCRSSND